MVRMLQWRGMILVASFFVFTRQADMLFGVGILFFLGVVRSIKLFPDRWLYGMAEPNRLQAPYWYYR